MKQYTVLLLRPDYIANEFGKDTYMAHVEALDAKEAQRLAQREAWDTDNEDAEDVLDLRGVPEDYYVLAVYVGWLDDIKDDISN